jgi:tetratricopeptide (TPR) repeat protein
VGGRRGQGGWASRVRPVVDWTIPGLIVLTPLAVGTVHVWTRALAFVAAAVALAVLVEERRAAERRVQATVPMLVLGVACVATLLQLVPLPSGLVGWLSPHAAYLFRQTLGDFGTRPLSLDPSGTVAELGKLLGYLAFLAAATNYASHSHRRRRLIFAVVGAGLAAALLGFAQAAARSRIWFFYEPRGEILNEILVRGPFVNPNHFGALMGLAAPCALAIYLRERALRVPAAIALLVLNLGAVLSLSRAALIVTPLAQAITFGLDWWQQRQRADGTARVNAPRLALMLIVVAAVGAAVAVGSTRATKMLAATRAAELTDPFENPQSKFHAWKNAGKLVMQYPWTGAGRGAFEQAYGPVNEQGGQLRYVWIENGYLQTVIDWGVPVAALVFVLSAWALLAAIRRHSSDALAIGATGALVGFAIHEVADFSFEIPGVGLPALALVAMLFARRREESSSDAGWLLPARRRLLLLPAAAVAAAIAMLLMPTADVDAARLARLARDPSVSTERVLAEGERVRARHPADFYVTALVAERLARDMHPQAMRWLNDAILLNPTHPTLHVIAGELLARGGHKAQALLEFRRAVGLSAYGQKIWARVEARWPATQDLLAATPRTDRYLVQLMGYLAAKNRFADADAVASELLRLDPWHAHARRFAVQMALRQGKKDVAATRAKALLEVDRGPESRRVAAEGYIAAGDLEAAAQILDESPDRTAAAFAVELRLAQAYAEKGDPARARTRLDGLTWAQERAQRIAWHKTRATVERLAGNEHQSRWELDQAKRLESQ